MMHTSYAKLDPAIRKQFTASVNAFSFNLAREVARKEGTANFFLSPFSVFSALAMLHNGAGGETRRAIAHTLAWQEEPETLNEAFAGLWEDLQRPEALSDSDKRILQRMGREVEEPTEPAYQLEIANSLWLNQEISINPAFLEKTREYFQAKAEAVDFQSPRTLEIINSWVGEQTHGKIPSIIDHLDPLTLLILLNAVYFKGQWSHPFSKKLTKEGDFHLPGGRKKCLPMMRMAQAKELRYFYTPGLEAVRLPYGRGRMSMYIFLPGEKISMDSFLNALTVERWQQWMQQLRSREGRVVLPRFQLDYAVQLNEPLQDLGMAPAFDPSTADFRPLSTGKPGIHVDEVRHKTFLEVNEEGTEAAAVTSVTVVFASAVQPPKPFTMIVDRPFVCAIRDDETGVLLFVGAVCDP